MRIAATLCWYDEPPEYLRRIVASIAPFVDCVVAFDGAWRGFPNGRAHSSPDQVQALRDIAAEYSLELRESSFGKVWHSQTAKRTALYRAASVDADWILTLDADEEARIDDVSKLRRELSRIDREIRADAVQMRVATAPGRSGSGGRGTATAAPGVRWQPRLLRADPTLTVGPRSHRTITTDLVVIQRDRGDDPDHHHEKGKSRRATIHGISIINRTHDRSAERTAAKYAYGKARDLRGID